MGHEVVFAGESSKTSFISDQGFDVIRCYEPDPDLLFGNIRSGKLRFVDDEEVFRMLEADIDVIRTSLPDIVLSDGRFTAALSTQIAKVRHAAIVNVSSTEYRALPYVPFFDWIPSRLISRSSRVWKSLDRLNLSLEMKLFDNVMNIFLKLSRKYKLDRPVTATNCLTGKDITLLADIPEYFPTRNLPPDYHYVGPLTWKSEIPPPPWWSPETFSTPLVYVTMGSTGVQEFFSNLSQILPSVHFTTIISTGGQPADLQAAPGKLFLESYIDGDLVIKHCDLVICHGGNGTIYQALSHGKPVIGIPTIPDQKFNMRRVEALGFGKSIDLENFLKNPSLLSDMIKQVLANPSFRNNAQSMQNILNRYHAATTSADLLARSCS
ncbi:hypothetical protein GHYDROH2_27700 [Geobacter hydrogenophilus]|uniref:Erythromycin biosynthesis protein CIII-like C-terminal domain-containing protein n=2 Tax=Geobacter hydrogenophilus TaxID=40983 RepID=A0A9W6LE22_9BACT|nr:hypothetical protein GHYDROH2_27700 [Geobacter hydrogenophilus]